MAGLQKIRKINEAEKTVFLYESDFLDEVLATKKHNAFFLLVITGLICRLFRHSDKCFLADDSINYLWPVVFVLVCMKSMVSLWIERQTFLRRWNQVLYALTGLIVGVIVYGGDDSTILLYNLGFCDDD